jgi:hypothetical protein
MTGRYGALSLSLLFIIVVPLMVLSACVDTASTAASATKATVNDQPASRFSYETEGLEVIVSVSTVAVTPADLIVVSLECILGTGTTDSGFPVPEIATPDLDNIGPAWELLGLRETPAECSKGSCTLTREYRLAVGIPGEYLIPPFTVMVPGTGILKTAAVPVVVSSVLPSDGADGNGSIPLRPVIAPELPSRISPIMASIGALLVLTAGIVVYLLARRRGRDPLPVPDMERRHREIETAIRTLASESTGTSRVERCREALKTVLRIVAAAGVDGAAVTAAVKKLEEQLYSGRPIAPGEAAELCRYLLGVVRAGNGVPGEETGG